MNFTQLLKNMVVSAWNEYNVYRTSIGQERLERNKQSKRDLMMLNAAFPSTVVVDETSVKQAAKDHDGEVLFWTNEELKEISRRHTRIGQESKAPSWSDTIEVAFRHNEKVGFVTLTNDYITVRYWNMGDLHNKIFTYSRGGADYESLKDPVAAFKFVMEKVNETFDPVGGGTNLPHQSTPHPVSGTDPVDAGLRVRIDCEQLASQ